MKLFGAVAGIKVIDLKRRLLDPNLLFDHVPGLPNRRLGWGLAPFWEATPPRDGPWHDHLHRGVRSVSFELLRGVTRDHPKSPRSAMTRCPGHPVSPRVVCAALFECWLVVPHKGPCCPRRPGSSEPRMGWWILWICFPLLRCRGRTAATSRHENFAGRTRLT